LFSGCESCLSIAGAENRRSNHSLLSKTAKTKGSDQAGSSEVVKASKSSIQLNNKLLTYFLPCSVSVNLPYHPKPAEALKRNSSQKTIEREGPANAKKPKKNKRNIADEFDRYFGNASELENWQRLCRDVGVQGDLPSMKQCRLVGRSRFTLLGSTL